MSFSTGSEISGAVSKLSWVVTVSGIGRSCSGVAGLHELSSSNGNVVKVVLGKFPGSRSEGSAPKSRLLLRLSVSSPSSEDGSLGGLKNQGLLDVVFGFEWSRFVGEARRSTASLLLRLRRVKT
jgi:hypothetical protein